MPLVRCARARGVAMAAYRAPSGLGLRAVMSASCWRAKAQLLGLKEAE